METINIFIPEEHDMAFRGICAVPFAKMDDGYRFAYWVYDLNDGEEKQSALLNSPHGLEAVGLIEKAKVDLKELLVSEEDYLDWTVHRKDSGGIKKYHKIIHDLNIDLLMLSITNTADEIMGFSHNDPDFYYVKNNKQHSDEMKKVLNRHNPFADVTIKSQQFFYKAKDGETGTLFFDTNNIVEKMDKNGRSVFTMRPSFSVSKEHGAVQRPTQKVMFANSITEPIVSDEDHIYVHIGLNTD